MVKYNAGLTNKSVRGQSQQLAGKAKGHLDARILCILTALPDVHVDKTITLPLAMSMEQLYSASCTPGWPLE